MWQNVNIWGIWKILCTVFFSVNLMLCRKKEGNGVGPTLTGGHVHLPITCCGPGHAGVGAAGGRGWLAHVHSVHGGALHRACWAEGPRKAGGARRLVQHTPCRRHGLELRTERGRQVAAGGQRLAGWGQGVCGGHVPGRRAGRRLACGHASGWSASAAPGASAAPSPALAGAGWPAASAPPGTPVATAQR